MSLLSFLHDSSGPGVAVELTARYISAASIDYRGGEPVVSAHAGEALPPGALVPSLTAPNVQNRQAVVAALGRVLEQVGRPRRVGLVLPDLVAKVSLVRFEQVPARAADLDQLIRWQVRKTAPFPIEEAQVSFVPGITVAPGLDAGAGAGASGQEFIVTLARRATIEDYEAVCADAGAHAGLVDLATFNVVNAVLAGTPAVRHGRLAARQRRAGRCIPCDHAGAAPHLLQEPRGRHRRHARRPRAPGRDVLRGSAVGRRSQPRVPDRRGRSGSRITRPTSNSSAAGCRSG